MSQVTTSHLEGLPACPVQTRYLSRVSSSDVWQVVKPHGFVEAILDSIDDGRDRLVLAWPSRPDNGAVAAALALRAARTTTALSSGTVALWPWRSGATFAARSILVCAEDIYRNALRKWQDGDSEDAKIARALCLVELRLKDLVKASASENQLADSRPSTTDPTKPRTDTAVKHNPTLLETTAVFEPSESQSEPPYVSDTEQVLKRVRRRTSLGRSPSDNISRVGDPLVTPFALMGLKPTSQHEIARCLGFPRFVARPIDVIVVDLTRTARRSLAVNWIEQLMALLSAIDSAPLPSRPPLAVLCEDAFVMRLAEKSLRRHSGQARIRRKRTIRSGALLLTPGFIGAADVPALPTLPKINFEADVKDASLRPLRDRIIRLSRRLRDSGHADAAIGLGRGLRVLSFFASLPVGVAEARKNAGILFECDSSRDIGIRSMFSPASALHSAMKAQEAPEFETDIRNVIDKIRYRISTWEEKTPISMKLSKLLSESEWNAPDVLLVLPNSPTVDIFIVSNVGIECSCTVIRASQLAKEVANSLWRRIIAVKPEPDVLRTFLLMRAAPERVLLLGDTAGVPLMAKELQLLASLREFAPLALRAKHLSSALREGGASETLKIHELEIRYSGSFKAELIDLSRGDDGYAGEVVQFRLESGLRVAYRSASKVLLFTPDGVRLFQAIAARKVKTNDSILVLHEELRDSLSEALSRSLKSAPQLKLYHERVAQVRERLPGATVTAKARRVLGEMRAIEPAIGYHELPNVTRWLSVEPSDLPQQPRAARDHRRFSVFMAAAGIEKTLADAYWEHAILPVRSYSIQEGNLFNRRIVQFLVDPEGVAAGAGWGDYADLWQAVVGSVDQVIAVEKEVGDAA